MPTSPGRRKRSIDIHKVTRGFTRDSLKNSLFSHNPKTWVTSSIYREEKKTPKIAQIGSKINSDPTDGWLAGRPLQECDRPLEVPVFCRTYWKDQLTGRLADTMSFFFTIQVNRPLDRLMYWVSQPLCTSVDCPVDWCSVIEFKKLYCLYFWPSLYILHLSEYFSNLSRTLTNSRWNRHTISTLAISTTSTHDFGFSDWAAPLWLPKYPLPRGSSHS